MQEQLERARLMKFKNDLVGLEKLLNSVDFMTRQYIVKTLKLDKK